MNILLKNSSIYLLSTILVSVVPLLLMPIMTRYLTTAEYGQVAMFQLLVTAFSAVVGFSVHAAANRKYFDKGISDGVLSRFNGACFQILLISTLIFFVLVLFFKEWMSINLGIPTEWIILGLISACLSFVIQIRLGQWQIRGQAKFFGVFQLFQSVLNGLLSVLLVVNLLRGAQGRIEAQLLIVLLFSILAIYLLYRDRLVIFFSWDRQLIKEALTFGVPLVPHVVGGFLLLTIDRLVINQELGLAEVGIYMVAVQLSSTFKIVFHAINKAYSPWLFGELKVNNLQRLRKIVKYTYFYFVLLVFISLLAFVIGPYFVVLIAGQKYQQAGAIIGILCLGNILNGMYLMVTNYIFYSKKTIRLSTVTVFSSIINIILLLVLIKPFGLIGAAYAYAISNFIMFILAWAVSVKSYEMPWFSIFKANSLDNQ